MAEWLQTELGRQAISSAILIVLVLLLRFLAARAVRRRVQQPELRRGWLVNIRNGLLVALLLGMAVIWAPQIQTLAFSLLAFAVAFVFAIKELLTCLSGSILKTGNRTFRVGDRIQVRDIRGDVIDQTLLATTILEVGPGKLTHQRTGRKIVLPNSLFITDPVINESFTDDYVLHVFTVPLKLEDDWRAAREALLTATEQYCRPYIEPARRHMAEIAEAMGLDTPSVDPRVSMQLPEAGEVNLVVRLPVPTPRRGVVEQQIIEQYLELRPKSPAGAVRPDAADDGPSHGGS